MLTSSCKKNRGANRSPQNLVQRMNLMGPKLAKAIEEEFGSKVVDFANIPNNLFVFYELNNQLQSTSTFLICRLYWEV